MGYYTIGQISKMYHIGVDSLRYYEKKGILCPIRGKNGYRYYDSHSIWRMNVITNLRNLGFSVDRIYEYFQNRTVESTKELLEEELEIIEKKRVEWERLHKMVSEQLDTIRQTRELEIGQVRMLTVEDRQAIEIRQDYSTDEEMDLLMMRLLKQSRTKCYMIGNNRLASVLSDDMDGPVYSSAVMFDEEGDVLIPGGTYLSVCYSGEADSRRQAAVIRAYAEEHNITIQPPFIEVVWVDVHMAADPEEYIYEVQVRVK